MPEEYRPDRIGVMFYMAAVNPPNSIFERIFIIGRQISASPNEAAAEDVVDFIQRIHPYMPIWRGQGDTKALAHPSDPDLIREAENPSTTHPGAMAWRAHILRNVPT